MEKQGSRGQGTARNPDDFDFTACNLSVSAQVFVATPLGNEEKDKRTRKPAVLRPKSETDCRFCREGKGKRTAETCETPVSWQLRE